ncbi:MAG: hypothetical protein IPF60_12875 [Betaproteobacteria bacterium]|nr:hypothetical protein [Betaproteobacteria bacterium]
MQTRWTVDSAIRAARALQPCQLVWLEEPTIPDDIHGHADSPRRRHSHRDGQELYTLHEFAHFHARAVIYPEPRRDELRWRHRVHGGRASAESFNLPLTPRAACLTSTACICWRRRWIAPEGARLPDSTSTSQTRCASSRGMRADRRSSGHGVEDSTGAALEPLRVQ